MTNDEENPLLEYLTSLGMAKAMRGGILNTDCEEDLAKIITVFGGIIQIVMTQFFGAYDRTALLNETSKIADGFKVSQSTRTKENPEVKEIVNMICAAYQDGAKHFQAEGVKVRSKINIPQETTVALFALPGVAGCVAKPLLITLPEEELKAVADGQIPELLLKAVVTGMDSAYSSIASEEVLNTFRFHARAALTSSAQKLYSKRFGSKDVKGQ